jgi:hypothetical protein
MSSRQPYAPGAPSGAEVRKDGDKWTLVLVRDLPHPPAKVWKALTEPEHLREWAPFDSDRYLGAVGTANNVEYAKQFGFEAPSWPSHSRS